MVYSTCLNHLQFTNCLLLRCTASISYCFLTPPPSPPLPVFSPSTHALLSHLFCDRISSQTTKYIGFWLIHCKLYNSNLYTDDYTWVRTGVSDYKKISVYQLLRNNHLSILKLLPLFVLFATLFLFLFCFCFVFDEQQELFYVCQFVMCCVITNTIVLSCNRHTCSIPAK